jgi:hypothetical protein
VVLTENAIHSLFAKLGRDKVAFVLQPCESVGQLLQSKEVSSNTGSSDCLRQVGIGTMIVCRTTRFVMEILYAQIIVQLDYLILVLALNNRTRSFSSSRALTKWHFRT